MSTATKAPKYRHYRPKNLAVVRIDGREHYLGEYDSAESREKYHRLVAEWLASRHEPPRVTEPDPLASELTVSEVLNAYREAYEAHLCPICEYPIRRGPLKFLYSTRRTIKRLPVPRTDGAVAEEPYSCPSCGTRLFEECGNCHAIRHSLLPTCEHCGATQPVEPTAATATVERSSN